MNENRSGGPNVGLLLLIPAAIIVAKAAARHHALMWDEVGEPGAVGRHSHGHHGLARGGSDAGALRLPPRIEWMLNTWHARAHETQAAPTDSPAV